MDIRRALHEEISRRSAFYVEEGTITNVQSTLDRIYPTPSTPVGWNKWMSMPSMGEAMANAFETPVFFFSQEYSQTCFPHFCGPNRNPPIFIAFLEKSQHFVYLHMKDPSSFPAPPYMKNWLKSATPEAQRWAEVYSRCLE